jgi:hypothetical protein
MLIVKNNGESVEFNPQKIQRTLRRTGATPDVIKTVMTDVEKRLRTGMTTRELSRLVRDVLRQESTSLAHRYNLKGALLKLGPAGFKFEKYVAEILNAYGYTTELPEELQGACVRHEVDVVARKAGRTVMIEAKFRNDFSHFVRLKDTMATWTRFNDLNDGAAKKLCPHFDQVWIVTNGQISSRSKRFGECKQMHMIGWNYPRTESLANMVDHAYLYPVTVIDALSHAEIESLAEHNYLLCRDLADKDPERIAGETGLSKIRAGRVIQLCREVVTPQATQTKK